jgi:glutamate/tyrosine decarboxylase-like PLP-dependent enzyme
MQLRNDGMQPGPSLFPSRAEREEIDDFLTRRLADADARIRDGSVTPTLAMAAFRRELAAFDFREPRDLEQSLSWIIAQLEAGIVHLTHPRYFGLFNPAPSFPAQCADRIAAVLNPQLATWTTSPAAVEVEAHVIAAVCSRLGFGNGAGGHFTTGGSEANYTALICALLQADPQFAGAGVRAFKGSPVFYVSRECHIAWHKIALQAGLGRSAVRLVATDGKGQMDPQALRAAITSDLEQGCLPIMLVATAGTTNAGMVDPLVACAQIAREFGLFYHVDAAWAGALIASDGLRGALAGIELADSATIDAHKWFATTMGCGMFLTRLPGLLSPAFQTSASYMPSNLVSVDPYVTSAQWSRRFLGLRLFLSLASAGWHGHGKHVERCVELAQLVRDKLRSRGWHIANDSPAAVVCAAPPPALGDVDAIVKSVLASGAAWVSVAVFEGRRYVRICITHGATSADDVHTLLDNLKT